MQIEVTDKLVERFMSKIKFFAPGECWEFNSYKDPDGYKHFSLTHKRHRPAHRVSFYLVNSYWPPVVRHLCNNPGCVNPEHLAPGTQADNIRDRDSQGRQYQQQKTHCPQGHIYSGKNLIKVKYVHPTTGEVTLHRGCRICKNERRRKRYKVGDA